MVVTRNVLVRLGNGPAKKKGFGLLKPGSPEWFAFRGTARRIGGAGLGSLADKDLLHVRICDLRVRIEGPPWSGGSSGSTRSWTRQIRFRPHCWLSDEWFSPDGVPGIAIPFYLAHPRLARLERKQMLEVEGGTEEWCMRILRHEAGHAIDTAYRLHRRRNWRETFGKYSQPIPSTTIPGRTASSYVLHLDQWYAQSHPAEDFAETFAVWLKPRSGWRTQYRGWPALKKLEYVDKVMRGLASKKPAGRLAAARGPASHDAQDAGRALPREAGALRARPSRLPRPRPAAAVLRPAGACPGVSRPPASCGAWAPSCAAPWPTGPASTSTRSTRSWRR